MKKYLFMILASVVLVSSLAACTPQSSQPSTQQSAPAPKGEPLELLTDALTSLQAVQSLELNTKSETLLDTGEAKQSSTSEMNVVLHAKEPISAKVSVNATSSGDVSGDAEAKYDVYMVTEGEDLYGYSLEESTWWKEEISTIDMNLFIENPIQKLEYFINGLGTINDLGTETVNGKEARVLEIITHPAIFSEYSTEFTNQFGLDYNLTRDCGDFIVKAWITADGLEKYEIDLTNNIKKLADAMRNAPEATEETKAQADFVGGISLKLTNTILSVDAAPEVVLPAGAEMALEIETPGGLDQTITITQEELEAAKAAAAAEGAGQ